MEDFDKVIEELQTSIIEEARKIYPEKVIEYWLEPKNAGKMDNPDGFARITGSCGDTIEISLKVRNDTIIDAKLEELGIGWVADKLVEYNKLP
ncbi:TPA: iron-sulfur cluster assembly scaffold protein [Candidatus Poribacteria bacterium]|nr:iron-sulfur cluster assembly scaffold protein [Candidatus Poribacteria bacterium]